MQLDYGTPAEAADGVLWLATARDLHSAAVFLLKWRDETPSVEGIRETERQIRG